MHTSGRRRAFEAAFLVAAAVYCQPALAQSPASAAPRIIGGEPVAPGQNTYQVGLLSAGEPNNFKAQFCGGTLIGTNWVVTAAHCIGALTARDIQVLTDTNKLDGSGVRHALRSVTVHPNFGDDPRSSDFDVAVLHLATPAEPGLQHAELITLDQEQKLAEPGDIVLASGWGNTSTVSQKFPQTLRKVQLPVVSRADCNAETSYDGRITPRMLCAGFPQGKKDTCQGDSGGPLVVAATKGGRRTWLLAGITSFGQGCAQPDFYGVYARVAVLRNWITAVIDRKRD